MLIPMARGKSPTRELQVLSTESLGQGGACSTLTTTVKHTSNMFFKQTPIMLNFIPTKVAIPLLWVVEIFDTIQSTFFWGFVFLVYTVMVKFLKQSIQISLSKNYQSFSL
jgi:hypothetical protein